MTAAGFVVQLIAGLSLGGLYFLVAAGLTLLLGSMDVINLAHGSFYMIAAYFATVIITKYGVNGGFLAALVLVPIAVMAVAFVIERLVMRWTYSRGHFVQLLATFALLLIIDDLVRTWFGTDPRTVGRVKFLSGSLTVLGLPVPTYNFFIMAAAAVVAVALFYLLAKTPYGRRIRASADDPEMVAAAGINLHSVRMGVFMLAAALAGIAGVMVAPSAAVQPGMDVDIIVTAFAVTIIGGLGSIGGALIGALIVGIIESIGVFYIQRGGQAVIFVIMVVVLAVRPTGIFGVRRVG
jgi:branched-subunit amino acid ABC-type transport system permease component